MFSNLSKTNIVILGLLTFALILATVMQFLVKPVATLPDGEQSASAEYNDLIKVTSPLPGSTISSPLVISGEARGMWYFEGSFPIVVVNWDGLIIGEGFATAEGDWMTEAYVPFTATITFEANAPVYPNGTLILQKNNASGLPELDDAFELPVVFADSNRARSGAPANGLAGTSWTWVTTEGAGTTPTPGDFVLQFDQDGRQMSSKTDCNALRGEVTITNTTLSFGPMMSTLMSCEGSLERVYATQLSQVNAYERTGTTLRLTLKKKAGVMVFTQN